MNKQILFSLLLITSTVAHGMKRQLPNMFLDNDNNTTMVLFDKDIMPKITPGICMSNGYRPCGIRTAIRALSDTCTFLHNYYAQEKVKQSIIDLCIAHNNSNTRSVARGLKCHAIYDKVKRFTNSARFGEQFNEDDLQDPWYLNITTTYSYSFYKQPLNRSLLYITIDNLHLDTAKTIIDHTEKLHFDYGKNKNPLLKIVVHCGWLEEEFLPAYQEELNKMLALAHSLLKKGILPDGRKKNTQLTPLMHAVHLCLKDLVRLLIEYDADPKLTGYDKNTKKTKNAFAFEWKKGWLQKIIDKAAANKKFKIAQSPTDQSAAQ